MSPVFILAPPRSFTSLACAMIGQHSEMYGVPELNLFMANDMDEFWSGTDPDGRFKSPLWPIQRHGVLRTVAHFFAGEQTIESIKMAQRWIRVRARLTTAQVYQILCEKAAPLRLIDKSPGYLRRKKYMDLMLQAFPDARFIHLLRHPRGQCNSILKVKGGSLALLMVNSIDYTGKTPILDPQIAWHDANLRILKFLRSLPPTQWIRIRGEDLLAHQDDTIDTVCSWLGIANTPEERERMRHPEHSPFSRFGPANARLGNDPNFLTTPRLQSGKAAPLSLEGPLPWRPDGRSFHPSVVALARDFGYV